MVNAVIALIFSVITISLLLYAFEDEGKDKWTPILAPVFFAALITFLMTWAWILAEFLN